MKLFFVIAIPTVFTLALPLLVRIYSKCYTLLNSNLKQKQQQNAQSLVTN